MGGYRKPLARATALWAALVIGAGALQVARAQQPAHAPESVAAGAAQLSQEVAAQDGAAPRVAQVVMHTALGEIRLALEVERAPATAANFLRYVDSKRFDGITFYRAVHVGDEGRWGLLQGGLAGDPSRVMEPVAHEAPAVTGLSHLNGAISMAHLGPGTATADWFIVLGDLPSMDGKGTEEDPGYAVFGRVTEGMEVVRAILAQPRDPEAGEGIMKGQMFAEPVKILTVRRID